MFNTSDSPPRSDGTRIKNAGLAIGGLGVGYAGLRVAKAADKIGRSTPAHVADKVKKFFSGRTRKLSAQLTGLIEFKWKHIKPYMAGTPYDSEHGEEMGKAVTKRREYPTHEVMVDANGQHIPTGSNKGDIPKKAKIVKRPLVEPDEVRKAWRAQNEGRKGLFETGEARGHEWLKDKSGKEIRPATPKDLVRPTKAFAKAKTNALLEKRNRSRAAAVNAYTDEGDRRAADAKFVEGTKRISGESVAGASIPGREAAATAHRAEIANVRAAIKKHVTEGRSLVFAHNKRTGKKLEAKQIPSFLREHRERLDKMVEHHRVVNKMKHQTLLGDIESKVSSALRERFNVNGREFTDEHIAKVARQHMEPLKGATAHNTDLEKHYGDLADLIGDASHPKGKISSIRQLHKQLEAHAAEAGVHGLDEHRKFLVRSGEVFNKKRLKMATGEAAGMAAKVRTNLRKSPLLRKAGIGAGVAIAAGGGIYAAKKKKESRDETELSSRARLVMFGSRGARNIKAIEESIQSQMRQAAEHGNLRNAVHSAEENTGRWIAPEHEGGVKAYDYEAHAIKNEPELLRAHRERKNAAKGIVERRITPLGLRLIEENKTVGKAHFSRGERSVKALTAMRNAPNESRGQRAAAALHVMTPAGAHGRKAIIRDLDIAAITGNSSAFRNHAKWARENGIPVGRSIKHHRQIVIGKLRNITATAKAHAAGVGMHAVEIEEARKAAERSKKQLENMVASGKDFPKKLEQARHEGFKDGQGDVNEKLETARRFHEENAAASKKAQKEKHAAAIGRMKSSHKKKLAIGAGAGAGVGVAAGRASKKDESKERQFGVPDAILRPYVAATNLAWRARRGLRHQYIDIARKHPLVKSLVNGAARGAMIPVPGMTEAGAIAGVAHGLYKRIPLVKEREVRDVMNRLGKKAIRMSSRSQVIKFEPKKERNPALIMGTSSALTGAALAAVPAAMRRSATLKGVAGALGKGALLGGTMGAGSALAGTAIMGRPDERDTTAYTRRGTIGGAATGALIGAGGLIAAKRMNGKGILGAPARELSRMAKRNNVAKFLHGSSIPLAATVAGLTGGFIGAAHGADEGQQVDTLRNLNKERMKRMSSKLKPVLFATKPSVALDRYKKQIHEKDDERTESNYLRSAIAGAALSGLLRKKTGMRLGKSLIAGAGAGAGTMALTRAATSRTKDQYGDRSLASKKIERLPWQIGGAAAIGLAGRRIFKAGQKMNLFSNGRGVIEFDEYEDEIEGAISPKRSRRSKVEIQIEKHVKHAGRAKNLIRDAHAALTNKKILDERGREKKKEWDRPWVRRAATGLIISGTAAGILGVKKIAGSAPLHSNISRIAHDIESGAAASAVKGFVKEKVPFAKKIMTKIDAMKQQAKDELASGVERQTGIYKHYRKFVDKYKEAGMSEAAKRAARKPSETKSARDILSDMKDKNGNGHKLSSMLDRIIAFDTQYDDNWEDWLRNRPGVAKRNRRGKRLHEREENKRIINQAKIGGALVAGTAIGALLPRHNSAATAKPVEEVIRKVAGKI